MGATAGGGHRGRGGDAGGGDISPGRGRKRLAGGLEGTTRRAGAEPPSRACGRQRASTHRQASGHCCAFDSKVSSRESEWQSKEVARVASHRARIRVRIPNCYSTARARHFTYTSIVQAPVICRGVRTSLRGPTDTGCHPPAAGPAAAADRRQRRRPPTPVPAGASSALCILGSLWVTASSHQRPVHSSPPPPSGESSPSPTVSQAGGGGEKSFPLALPALSTAGARSQGSGSGRPPHSFFFFLHSAPRECSPTLLAPPTRGPPWGTLVRVWGWPARLPPADDVQAVRPAAVCPCSCTLPALLPCRPPHSPNHRAPVAPSSAPWHRPVPPAPSPPTHRPPPSPLPSGAPFRHGWVRRCPAPFCP